MCRSTFRVQPCHDTARSLFGSNSIFRNRMIGFGLIHMSAFAIVHDRMKFSSLQHEGELVLELGYM